MGNIQNTEEKKIEDKKEPEKTTGQKFAAIILGIIFFVVIFYVVSLTFDFKSFTAALVLAFLTVYTTPEIINQLMKTPVLTYYSIFLTITLFLSINDYKNNNEMMLLLVTHILTCAGVFLTDNIYISHMFIFTNFYIVLRIFVFFSTNPQQENNSDPSFLL